MLGWRDLCWNVFNVWIKTDSCCEEIALWNDLNHDNPCGCMISFLRYRFSMGFIARHNTRKEYCCVHTWEESPNSLNSWRMRVIRRRSCDWFIYQWYFVNRGETSTWRNKQDPLSKTKFQLYIYVYVYIYICLEVVPQYSYHLMLITI